MKKIITALFICFSLIAVQSIGQSKKPDVKKNKTTVQKEEEEVKPIEESVSESDNTAQIVEPESQVPIKLFDTSAIPQDELTSKIRILLKVTNALNIGNTMANQLMDLMKSPQYQSDFMKDYLQRLQVAFVSEEVKTLMEDMLVRQYRKYYNVDEINQVISFYMTPIGKKSITLMPKLMTASMEEGNAIGKYIGEKIYSQMLMEKK